MITILIQKKKRIMPDGSLQLKIFNNLNGQGDTFILLRNRSPNGC